jgi:hypothetical protein
VLAINRCRGRNGARLSQTWPPNYGRGQNSREPRGVGAQALNPKNGGRLAVAPSLQVGRDFVLTNLVG